MPGPAGAPGGRALTDDELAQLVMPPDPVARPRRRVVRRGRPGQAARRRAAPPPRPLARLRRHPGARVNRNPPHEREALTHATRPRLPAQRTARNASLVSQLAPAAATSRRIAWSFVTTTTARSTGVGADLGADHVVGDHARAGVHDPRHPPPRCVGADDVGPVEHDREVAPEAAGELVDEVEAALPLARQVVVGPCQLGDVVAVDEDERRRASAAGARSPAASRGRRRRGATGRRDPSCRPRSGWPGGRRGRGPTRASSRSSMTCAPDTSTPPRSARSASSASRWALRGLGAVDRRVAVGLDAGQPAAGGLGAVVGVARRRAGRRRARRGGPRASPRAPRPRPRARRQLRRSARRSRACRADELGAGARGGVLGRLTPAFRPRATRTRRRRAPRRPHARRRAPRCASSQPSSRRSHSMPIGSTSSGSAPAASRRRKSASASIARRSLPRAPLGIRGWRRNGLSAAG